MAEVPKIRPNTHNHPEYIRAKIHYNTFRIQHDLNTSGQKCMRIWSLSGRIQKIDSEYIKYVRAKTTPIPGKNYTRPDIGLAILDWSLDLRERVPCSYSKEKAIPERVPQRALGLHTCTWSRGDLDRTNCHIPGVGCTTIYSSTEHAPLPRVCWRDAPTLPACEL